MKNYSIGRLLRLLAIFWLVIVFAFSLGIYTYSSKKWPYPVIKSLEAFIAGNSEEKTGIVQKIQNDLDITPNRHLVKSQKEISIPDNYSKVNGLPLNSRREEPKIFISENAPKGYRLIYGCFDFKDSVHGVILFGPNGNVENIWRVSQEDVDWNHRSDLNVFPHGIVVFSDGSIVTAFDSGTSLTKYDYCGNIVWRIKGGFHHSIASDSNSAIWTWGNAGAEKPYGENLIKIDHRTGEVLKEFHLSEIMLANPDIDIFGILQKDTAEGCEWISDENGGRWHANDIEPLTTHLSSFYPQFESGDLLVSLRAPDLIFVVDPETYKVKWWRQGLTRRQHDPDFNAKGTITVFNNNMHRGYSSIVELNPDNFNYEHVVKGKKYDFYSWMQGKHQLLPNGGFLITSSRQGRVFEVNEKGEITFEFFNYYGGGRGFLGVSEAIFLPLNFFKELPKCNY